MRITPDDGQRHIRQCAFDGWQYLLDEVTYAVVVRHVIHRSGEYQVARLHSLVTARLEIVCVYASRHVVDPGQPEPIAHYVSLYLRYGDDRVEFSASRSLISQHLFPLVVEVHLFQLVSFDFKMPLP